MAKVVYIFAPDRSNVHLNRFRFCINLMTKPFKIRLKNNLQIHVFGN